MSLAMITEKNMEAVKIALNDAIQDIDKELKEDVTGRKRVELLDYKDKYLKVCNKLRQNPSIYSLNETELDIAAGGLNDAIQLLDEIQDGFNRHDVADILSRFTDDGIWLMASGPNVPEGRVCRGKD